MRWFIFGLFYGLHPDALIQSLPGSIHEYLQADSFEALFLLLFI